MSQRDTRKGINRKIKSQEEIEQIIGTNPRNKTVVLCLGVFDILHPGHLRHLMYAKEHADILVASVISDKGTTLNDRQSFVPQELRALNLAALEFVDYVFIDQNSSSLETIRTLKPNFFAKGYESFPDSNEVTRREREAVTGVGGELLLTPGDATYSYSANPGIKLSAAKLLILMQAENITFQSLRDALGSTSSLKIHVIGDTLVDITSFSAPTGGITKSPTVSVVVQKETQRVGGAGAVALNFAKAGATVELSTVLGDDSNRLMIEKNLLESGVFCHSIVDPTRPTPVRTTYVAQNHTLLRTNSFDNRIISEKVTQALAVSLKENRAGAYVFCDYRFGIFARNTIPPLVEAVPPGVFKAADSQVASRWGNVLEFSGFDLITPNEREARFALGDQDSVMRPLALEVFNRAKCKLLLLKIGDRGVFGYRAANPDPKSFFTIDSFAEHIADPDGAGDAFLAYSTLGMLTSKSEVTAAILGIFASAVACEKGDNMPILPQDVLAKIFNIEQLASSIDDPDVGREL